MIFSTPNGAFALLLAALGVFSVGEIVPGRRRRRAGKALMTLAWLLVTAFLTARWIGAGHVPLSNQYESVVFLCWAFLGLYLAYGRRLPVQRPGLLAALFSLLLLGLASLLDRSVRPLVPALQSNWLLLHVSVTLAAYAGLSFSFLAGLARILPAASAARGAELDDFTYRSLSLGFILLTAGIVLGAVWANEAWGSYWSWDPKETWSLITWFVYLTALHLRQAWGWRGERFAWLSIAGFTCVAFTYFGVNYLLQGLHAYG